MLQALSLCRTRTSITSSRWNSPVATWSYSTSSSHFTSRRYHQAVRPPPTTCNLRSSPNESHSLWFNNNAFLLLLLHLNREAPVATRPRQRYVLRKRSLAFSETTSSVKNMLPEPDLPFVLWVWLTLSEISQSPGINLIKTNGASKYVLVSVDKITTDGDVRLCAVYIAKGDNYVVVLDHDGNLKPNRDADAKMNDLYQDKILASILPELRNVSIIEALLRGSHPQRPKLFPAPELFLNVLQTPSASDILKIATPIKTAEKHRSEKVLGRAVSPSVTLCATRHPDEETHTTTVDVTEQTCWTSAILSANNNVYSPIPVQPRLNARAVTFIPRLGADSNVLLLFQPAVDNCALEIKAPKKRKNRPHPGRSKRGAAARLKALASLAASVVPPSDAPVANCPKPLVSSAAPNAPVADHLKSLASSRFKSLGSSASAIPVTSSSKSLTLPVSPDVLAATSDVTVVANCSKSPASLTVPGARRFKSFASSAASEVLTAANPAKSLTPTAASGVPAVNLFDSLAIPVAIPFESVASSPTSNLPADNNSKKSVASPATSDALAVDRFNSIVPLAAPGLPAGSRFKSVALPAAPDLPAARHLGSIALSSASDALAVDGFESLVSSAPDVLVAKCLKPCNRSDSLTSLAVHDPPAAHYLKALISPSPHALVASYSKSLTSASPSRSRSESLAAPDISVCQDVGTKINLRRVLNESNRPESSMCMPFTHPPYWRYDSSGCNRKYNMKSSTCMPFTHSTCWHYDSSAYGRDYGPQSSMYTPFTHPFCHDDYAGPECTLCHCLTCCFPQDRTDGCTISVSPAYW